MNPLRRIAFVVALVVALAAGIGTGGPARGQAAPARNGADTVKALYAAFERGDVPAINGLLAPDITWTYYGPREAIPFAGTWKGPDGVMSWFELVESVIKVEHMDIQSVEAAGDKVYARGVERTLVPSTGGRYAANWVHAFTVRDGRITSYEEIIDSGAVADAFTPADVGRGRAYYTTCAGCHAPDASGNRFMNAPNLSGQDTDYLVRQLRNFQSEVRGGANSLYGWMMNGRAKALPSDRALRDVAAFIATQEAKRPARTLRVGDAARGKALYTTCAECHGAGGEGNRDKGAPRLTLLDDWYVDRQLQGFASGERGAHAGDDYGAQMKAGMAVLKDARAIQDVTAYIASLP